MSSILTNERPWIEFQTQIADTKHERDAHLRARSFYLAENACQHTSKILSFDALIEALVETNVAVLRGLKGKV